MKIKKLLLSILSFVAIFTLHSTKVSALVARVVYNPVNVFISNIMKTAPIIFTIVYIISIAIYYIKSKKDKKSKMIKIIIWLIIIVIMSTVLYCCADMVLEAGAIYSSRPMNF